MTASCEGYGDELAELAIGRLEGDRARRLESHLATCDDCRALLEVMRAVRRAPAPVPAGLEARLRSAVHEAAAPGIEPVPFRPPAGAARERARSGWRSRRRWAVPLAAAAMLATIWLGLELEPEAATTSGAEVESVLAEDEYEPYGSWPASGEVVAGELVLSELSVEELERILEEMES